jgi:hypothetical protein
MDDRFKPYHDFDAFDFMQTYVDVCAYAGWPNPNYLRFKIAIDPTKAMQTFCRLVDEGHAYPHLKNFQESIDLTQQFLLGLVDIDRLARSVQGLKENLAAVQIFDDAIELEENLYGFPYAGAPNGRPFKLLRSENFKNALHLLYFIEEHIDASSGYTLMRPSERLELKSHIQNYIESMTGSTFGTFVLVPS